MLHSFAQAALHLHSLQFASPLQNLLSFPLRPASSAQRVFPVVEEQRDSLPVLCVKKHQGCPPSPDYCYTGQSQKHILSQQDQLHVNLSLLTQNTLNTCCGLLIQDMSKKHIHTWF